MLALSRSQKLPQPGEDTQVRDTVYTHTRKDNTQSVTETTLRSQVEVNSLIFTGFKVLMKNPEKSCSYML